LAAIEQDDIWPALLARWEMGLLEELGFGLDLKACAATGTRDGLAFVSPRSGRAVSATAGAPYRDRLFRLPDFLRANAPANATDIVDGLRITGYFLDRHVFEPRGASPPEQRQWIIRALAERPH
ncbi:MAG: DNA repair protein RecO C-terminal domain-containing protein, partial [Alphaproteobacteria bacterium]|nr:DNA repair protein RecO C-terminal domain-containing protein [Alphaproteobacteria bacterium]